MNLSINLKNLKYADVGDAFNPGFGEKKVSNGGSLTTKEFNEAIFMPFTNERALSITENTNIKDVEYDAKLCINTADITVALGTTAFVGASLEMIANKDFTLVYNGNSFSVKEGSLTAVKWDGEKWISRDKALIDSYSPLVFCDSAINTNPSVRISEYGMEDSFFDDGKSFKVFFKNDVGYSAAQSLYDLKLVVNGISAKMAVFNRGTLEELGHHNVPSGSSTDAQIYIQAGTTVEFMSYRNEGTLYWVVVGHPVVITESVDDKYDNIYYA